MQPAPPKPADPVDAQTAQSMPPERPADHYDAAILAAAQAARQFHVMVKPAGSACNLDCDYCFYLSKENLPGGPGAGRMSEDVLERFIERYIAGVTGPEVVFSWQGGEPTLMGLDFYRRVIALQRKYAKPGQRIENDLQTNGTLIDDEWCSFLKENSFLVGLSIDGPRDIHDHYRVTKGRLPTFDKVMETALRLHRHAIPFNTLTCVSRIGARRPLDVYRFLRRELDSTCIQFIPVVEPKGFEHTAPQRWNAASLPRDGDPEARPGHPHSVVTEWSVDPDDWGYFLCKTFDEWLNRDLGKVMVSQFETLVSQRLGLGPQICVYGEHCGRSVAVEHDGSAYSCDHYVYPEYRLGNVGDTPLDQLVFSRRQVKFGFAKSETLPQYCRDCAHLTDCWGECPKNRFLRTPAGEPGLNYLCPGLRQFFAHASPGIERIVAGLRQQRLQPRRRL